MNQPFNKLSLGEIERLALLIEEANEVGQAACKVLRHGWKATHMFSPDRKVDYDNRADLEKEMGHLAFASSLLFKSEDVSVEHVADHNKLKSETIGPLLHHQDYEERCGAVLRKHERDYVCRKPAGHLQSFQAEDRVCDFVFFPKGAI
jgi:hypothetical protein